jgi:phosphoribosylamine--glycine ligase
LEATIVAEVLVIGSGGREQALAWKLAQSNSVSKVYVAPGNAGSNGLIENVDIAFDDVSGLVDFARSKQLELSVVGQEAASEAGVVDAFNDSGLTIFGPTKAAVRIESSKAFSKDLMAKKNIQTAQFKNFSDATLAREYAKSRTLPVVIKADGLATGKGVIIAEDAHQIDEAIDSIMVKKVFGASGDEVVIEDFLVGQEVSMHALCDGERTVMLPSSQDHKQVNDGDQGPNTGGMGVIAPVEWISKDDIKFVKEYAVEPALKGLKEMGAEFKGCLYPGLMINDGQIKLLEFNARFGDPETEVYMRLLDSDLYEILKACAEGNLNDDLVKWKSGYAVSVVLASPGYPASYPIGLPITGIEEAESQADIVVFHAGTSRANGQLVTAGGRVLNVTASGVSLDEALDKAYSALKLIHFEGMHYRTDIGRRV